MLPSSSAQGYIVLPFQMNKQASNTIFSTGELVSKDSGTYINTTHGSACMSMHVHTASGKYSPLRSPYSENTSFVEQADIFAQHVQIIISSFSSISLMFLEN